MNEAMLQTLGALGLVAGALVYLGLRVRRTVLAARRVNTNACGGDCGCSPGH